MISVEDLNDIEQNVLKVHALISTVRNSCANNNYCDEELTAKYSGRFAGGNH